MIINLPTTAPSSELKKNKFIVLLDFFSLNQSYVVNEGSDMELVIFSHLTIMINSLSLLPVSFADCLNHFISLEELADSELYICPNCKKRQRSTKKFWLKRLPNVRQLNFFVSQCLLLVL